MIFRARGGQRGRPVANAVLMEEMRRPQTQLEAMETGRQRDPEPGDVSECEEEAEEEAKAPAQESAELKLLRSVLQSSSRPKPELSTYNGSLTAENLIDLISEVCCDNTERTCIPMVG